MTMNDVGPQMIGDTLKSVCREIQVAAQEGRPLSSFVPFHLPNVARAARGMMAGELVAVSGVPGVGKSALVNGLAVATAEAGSPALVFSLASPRDAVCRQMLCARAGVDAAAMVTGRLPAEQWGLVASALPALVKLPVWVDSETEPTLDAVCAKARQVASAAAESGHPLRMVVVDYLQAMRVDSRPEYREQSVTSNERGLKRLARELGVVVVLVSEVNRKFEGRGKDAEPQLSDLRESGAIEQDADQVIFLHANGQDPEGVVTVIGAKSRTFGTWRTKLHFDAVHTRFLDYDEQSAPPPDARGW
jgi:replicative DNA helicase